MQEKILNYLQTLATPALDIVFNISSMFGEDLIVIAIIAWIYWNHDKYRGFILSFTLVSSLVLNNSLKIIFRSPRPFQVIPDLVGKRIYTATGYSFPSGHTQIAATFYASLSLLFRKKLLTLISLIIIVAVALSRVYLAVHWPIDVLASIILGGITSVLLVPYLQSISENRVQIVKFVLFMNIVSVIILFVLILFKIFVFHGELYITDLVKTIGLLNGISWGFVMEIRKEIFIVKSQFPMKVIRFLLGLTGAFALVEGLKIILPAYDIFQYLRYVVTGFWIIWVYPKCGQKLKLFKISD